MYTMPKTVTSVNSANKTKRSQSLTSFQRECVKKNTLILETLVPITQNYFRALSLNLKYWRWVKAGWLSCHWCSDVKIRIFFLCSSAFFRCLKPRPNDQNLSRQHKSHAIASKCSKSHEKCNDWMPQNVILKKNVIKSSTQNEITF